MHQLLGPVINNLLQPHGTGIKIPVFKNTAGPNKNKHNIKINKNNVELNGLDSIDVTLIPSDPTSRISDPARGISIGPMSRCISVLGELLFECFSDVL